jgi:hypothetical protein
MLEDDLKRVSVIYLGHVEAWLTRTHGASSS